MTLTADLRTQRGLGNSSSVAEMDRVPEEQGLNVASASPCEIILHFVLDFFFSLSQGSSVGASGCDPYSHMLLLGWENIREVCSRLCWPWEGGLCGDHGEVSG